MSAIQSFLVPVDGSEPAWRALDFAARLARSAPEGVVHVLYVHPRIDVSGKVQIFVSELHMREMAMKESQPLIDAAKERLGAAEVAHSVEILEGDAADVIARRATERGCDAIVMGTRGMGRVASFVIGSVATRVLHLASIPVTLIK
jgi:nucleotide-binding universal stress UspA family protein